MFAFIERLFANRRQPTPTRVQWFADVGNLERLREILTDPVFVAACNFISDEARMNVATLSNPDLIPLRAAYSAGMNGFRERLEWLATAPKNVAPLPEEWSHIDHTYFDQR